MDSINMDLVQEQTARLNQQAIDAVRQRVHPARPSRTHCLDCGHEIPAGRRQHVPGCERCLDCQKAFEEMRTWRG
ncbi:MAG: TraR/DksA C4-type zinc finger protein [Thermodesulfobacteriota bacterium]